MAPGTYSGAGNINLDFLGKDIAVVSEGGPAVTTIDVQLAGRGFHLHSNLPATARVEGFSIINGTTSGILITESWSTIRNCIVRGNAPDGILASDPNYAGVDQIATIEDCIVSENAGNGLKLVGHLVQVNRCTFENNGARGLEHNAFSLGAGSGTYVDCIVRNNTAGGILFNDGFTGGTFTDCEITDHATTGGGAGVLDTSDEGQPRFIRCLFARNHSTNGAGGGAVIGGIDGARFSECRFENNSATRGGGLSYGHFLGIGPIAPVENCTFVNNTATTTGGALFIAPNRPELSLITGNLFWNNSAGVAGGAVALVGEIGITTLASSTLVGNSAPTGAGVYILPGTFSIQTEIRQTIIAFSSGGPALSCGENSPTNVVCSDFFGNPGGDWVGCVAGELGVDGNIAADPQFCDAANGDFHLRQSSPCAPAQSGTCGLIGAFGVACLATPVQPTTWGSIKAIYNR